MDEMDEMEVDYLARSYPLEIVKQKAENMTVFDRMMIAAVTKMKEKYKEHTNRRHIVVLTPEEVRKIRTYVLSPTKMKKGPGSKTKQKSPAMEVAMCQATKMNGEKCTAKAKPDCQFCGRHKGA